MLLGNNADVNERVLSTGWSALNFALANKDEIMLKLLLRSGAGIHSKDNDGQSPVSCGFGKRREYGETSSTEWSQR